jgi:hypothetical protein
MDQVIQSSRTGKAWIKESLSKGVVRADICSAYIRSEAFLFFFENILNSSIKIRVLARWAPGDLISQASDLATFELCREKNIDFFIKQDFHGKLYELVPHGVLIGSFNLTNSGFSISNRGNDEAGVLIQNNKETIQYFDQLFLNARLVDEELYSKMSNFLAEKNKINNESTIWPDDILALISLNASPGELKILVNECLSTTFNEFMKASSEFKKHDLSLLSIAEKDSQNLALIKSSFKNLKIYKWFYSSLKKEQGELYFGKATALLHDKLLDDPKPYRQETKTLLVNLLSWIEGLQLEEITIDRPNYSQRIVLNK